MDNLLLIWVVLTLLIGLVIGLVLGGIIARWKFRSIVPEIRKDAVQRSRAILAGQFSEQLAPYLPDFPYSPNEVKFLGRPVDFIVFRGSDERNIEEIVFLEIKSGRSALSDTERSLKNAVEDGRVRWELYRIPEKLTRSK